MHSVSYETVKPSFSLSQLLFDSVEEGLGLGVGGVLLEDGLGHLDRLPDLRHSQLRQK
jgi:hypothetical protein